MTWKITYYNDAVYQDIKNLSNKMISKYFSITDRMILIGPNIGLPHTRPMGEGLFEIRLKDEKGIARVFYCTLKNREIVMLHTFIKKTQKTPNDELKFARKRVEELKKND